MASKKSSSKTTSAKTKTTATSTKPMAASKSPVRSPKTTASKKSSSSARTSSRSAASKARKTRNMQREESVDVRPITTSTTEHARAPRVRRSVVIAAIAAIVILLLAYSLRGLFVAAWVNGAPIWRLSVVQALEQQGGSQVLQQLETNILIEQAAAKKHITVSQKDIDNQIKQIEKNLSAQGQTLEAALSYQHMTKDQLEDEIRIKLMEDKLVGTPVISDKEAQDYMDKNKDSLPEGTTLAQVKQQLSQQQVSQKEQDLVSKLQSSAKIIPWVSY